jgi:hypothetical protein
MVVEWRKLAARFNRGIQEPTVRALQPPIRR